MTRRPSTETYPFLPSVWRTGSEFLERFEATEAGGVLLQPFEGEPPSMATEGALLQLRIEFKDRSVEFDLHAQVLERQPRGLRLEFVPEERSRLELVLTSARGESLPYFRRRHPRIVCQLPVELEVLDGGEREETATLTISEGGASLAVGELELEEDTPVQLAITFPGEARLTLRGRVTSIATSGPRPSMGVEFRFRSADERDALSMQVRSLGEDD
jgi:hypothetical protein